MKRVIISFLVILFCLSFISAEDSFLLVKEKEFTTPELATMEIVNGIKNANIKQIFSACAINEVATKFDFKKYGIMVGSFAPLTFKAPSTNEMYIDINKLDIMYYIARQVKMLSYSLLIDGLLDTKPRFPFDGAAATKVQSELDTSRLKKIIYTRSDFPSKKFEHNESYINKLNELAANYGAEEATERLVLISFENHYYVFGIHLLRYGNFWKADFLNSLMAITDVSGLAEITTLANYINSINDDK
jgi:hypothetical protein